MPTVPATPRRIDLATSPRVSVTARGLVCLRGGGQPQESQCRREDLQAAAAQALTLTRGEPGMTLVMGLIHAPLAFHVGDRLVTNQEKGRREPWDPLANKSVLVLAQNGYMCISYSGLAYINGKPTDQWLAEAASDRQTIPGGRGGLMTLFDTTLMPRIGPALSRVRAAIETDFAKQPLRYRRNGMNMALLN